MWHIPKSPTPKSAFQINRKEEFTMKKILSVALAVLMLTFALAACDKPGANLAYGKECLAVATQLDALNGLVKGDADIAVIDSVMAGYYMSGVDTFKDYQV